MNSKGVNMSEYDWDDEDFSEAPNDSGAMKELRKAHREAQKRNKEMAAQLESLQSSLRERSVRDILDSKNIPAKVAALVPKNITSAEDVESWLTEFGDLFGLDGQGSKQDESKPKANPELEKWSRISSAQSTGETYSGDNDQMSALIKSATTVEELNKLLHGNSTGPLAM
jgi:hypothetical protein